MLLNNLLRLITENYSFVGKAATYSAHRDHAGLRRSCVYICVCVELKSVGVSRAKTCRIFLWTQRKHLGYLRNLNAHM